MKKFTISNETKVCGVIGDPVEHSISPAMHNAAFRKLELNYVYLPFHVRKDGLVDAINGMRSLNIRGVNVTIPHKTTVIPLLDRVDDLAVKIGAVNTIVNDDGILVGYNTDADGFMKSLLMHSIGVDAKTAIIIGAGGAARAIAFALLENGANLNISNRSIERAAELARQLSDEFGRKVESMGLEKDSIGKSLERADILVNATSIGMNPAVDDTPVPRDLLRNGMVIVDIVYNPLRTRLLREGKAAGAKTISGIDMLVFQGASAFEKFTEHKAPVEVMKKAAVSQLTIKTT